MAHSIHVLQDMIVEVLSRLHGDATTLKTCSLSHAFHHPSRYHLLSTVALHSIDGISTFHRQLLKPPKTPPPSPVCSSRSHTLPWKSSDMLQNLSSVRQISIGAMNRYRSPTNTPNFTSALSLSFSGCRILFIVNLPVSLLRIAQNSTDAWLLITSELTPMMLRYPHKCCCRHFKGFASAP